MTTYALPTILENACSQKDYIKWLNRRANAHFKQDKKKNKLIFETRALYKHAIHKAVLKGGDRDAYTGELLRWDLIRKFNNKEAQKRKREYKRKFADMPTVDHINEKRRNQYFKICSWRTNDCKNDLTIDELIKFCTVVLDFQKNEKMCDIDQLAFKLFKKFARIEYALKAAGFHHGEGEAKPNWDSFASSVSGKLENDPAISAAIEYMSKRPPKKQVIQNSLIKWEYPPHNTNITHEILQCVRRVRNNLFHGGKFNYNWFAPERSKKLILHSINILDACLRASPTLKEAFENE